MTTLKDLAPAADYSLKDFSPSDDEKSVAGNKGTIAHIAAYGAALGDSGDPVENYRIISSQMEATGNSPLLESIKNKFKEREYERGRAAFLDIMSDPDISDEVKQAAIQTFSETLVPIDIKEMVSEEAVISGSSTVDSEETEIIENNIINNIRAINGQARRAESFVNMSKLGRDQSTTASVVDFLEMIVPFAEGKQIGSILSDIRKAKDEDKGTALLKGLFLMGEGKREIIDTVRAIPPLEREKVYAKIIEIVENNDSLILPDGNLLSSLTILKQALNLESYSTAEQMFDNAVSILDAIGLGATAKGLIRFARRGRQASRMDGFDDPLMAEDLGPDDSWDPSGFGNVGRGPKDDVIIDVDDYEVLNEVNRIGPTDVSPSSLSQNYKNVNIEKSRAVHEAAMQDEEAAKVLYGTSQEDVALHDLGPEIGNPYGVINVKTPRANHIHEMEITPDPDIMDFVTARSDTYLWKVEKEAMRTSVVRDFKNAFGLTPRPEMTSIRSMSDGVHVRAVYGPTNSGFANPREALDHTKFIFRNYGLDDEHVTLLVRKGNSYYPTSIEDVEFEELIRGELERRGLRDPNLSGNIDYLVGVDYYYRFAPEDLPADNLANMTVKNNFFSRYDMFSGSRGHGSLTSHLFDKDSLFDPKITASMNEHVDKSGRLENLLNHLGAQFIKPFSSLPAKRKELLSGLIKKANVDGIEYTDVDLVARGLSQDEIKIMKSWRAAWDTHYWLENSDKAITLRTKGYQAFVNNRNNTRLYAIPKDNSYSSGVRSVYDPITDSVITMTPKEVQDLYDNGGTIAELISEIDVGGVDISLIKVSNNPDNYLRKINDNDTVLNYRRGYYQVQYKDPIFIDEIIYDANGNVKSKHAIATAETIDDANHMIRRLYSTTTSRKYRTEYVPRHDRVGTPSFKESQFQMAISGGRIAQKFRGVRLQSSNYSIVNPSQENIQDPIEVMVNASRSISSRVMMRNAIETTRARFMKQYRDLLPEDGSWPSNSLEIKPRHGDIRTSRKRVADARDYYEYISFLETGYANSIDDGFKALMNYTADMVGNNFNAKALEKILRKSGKIDISEAGRAATFKILLASAPIRQFIVQGHQSTQLLARFPAYFGTRLVPDSVNLWTAMLVGRDYVTDTMLKASKMTRAEFDKMVDDFIDTGLWENVDKHNFRRHSQMRMVDSTVAQRLGRLANEPLELLQVVGFDTGERIVQITSWLAHRDDAIRKGLDLNSREVLGEIHGASRAFTYSMNRAGEMPYNENSLSLIALYMQVPHKAFLQMFTNRHLPKSEKAKLLALNVLGYGSGIPVATTWLINMFPEDPQWADLVNYGFIPFLYNYALSKLYGEEVGVDFSSLDPASLDGIYQLTNTIISDGLMSGILNTPFLSLFFGDDPRITNFAKTVGRFAGIQEYEDPTTFRHVAHDAMSIFSGYSHLFRAAYALEAGKKLNSYGGVSDDDVNFMEALAISAGFRTRDELRRSTILEKLYGGVWKGSNNEIRNDARNFVNSLKKHLFISGITQEEIDYTLRVHSEAWRVFDTFDQKGSRNEVFKILSDDVRKGDYRLMNLILGSASRGKTLDEVKEMIASISDDNVRTFAFNLINHFEQSRQESE